MEKPALSIKKLRKSKVISLAGNEPENNLLYFDNSCSLDFYESAYERGNVFISKLWLRSLIWKLVGEKNRITYKSKHRYGCRKKGTTDRVWDWRSFPLKSRKKNDGKSMGYYLIEKPAEDPKFVSYFVLFLLIPALCLS